jgi:hypothetical protein
MLQVETLKEHDDNLREGSFILIHKAEASKLSKWPSVEWRISIIIVVYREGGTYVVECEGGKTMGLSNTLSTATLMSHIILCILFNLQSIISMHCANL